MLLILSALTCYCYFLLLLLLYFISFAKKNQINRKNVGRDTATAVANYSWPHILTRNIKKYSDTRKTMATYKLLEKTRDEHYYILNR